MLLCVDIGNTNIKLGIYDNKQLRREWELGQKRCSNSLLGYHRWS